MTIRNVSSLNEHGKIETYQQENIKNKEDDNINTTIFVRNLNYEISDTEFQGYFESIGPIKHAFLARERHKGTPRGFGFVEYIFSSDAERAIKLFNNNEWKSRKLHVEQAANDTANLSKNIKKYDNKDKKKIKKTINLQVKIPNDIVQKIQYTMIILSNISNDLKYDTLLDTLNKHGPKVSVLLYPTPESTAEQITAKVIYNTKEEAKKAYKIFNNYIIDNNKIIANLSVVREIFNTSCLVLRNLPFNIEEEDIKNLFKKYTQEPYSIIIPSSNTKKGNNTTIDDNNNNNEKVSRGYAFVQMDTVYNAQQAINKINGKKCNGRVVIVDYKIPTKDYKRLLSSKETNDKKVDKHGSATIDNNDNTSVNSSDSDSDSDSDSGNDSGSDNNSDSDNNTIDENAKDDSEIKYIEGSKDVKEKRTIFVRNQPYDIKENEQKDICEIYGKIKQIKLVKDAHTNMPSGTAFVEYKDKSSAENIIKQYDSLIGTDVKKIFNKKNNNIKEFTIRDRVQIISYALPREKANEQKILHDKKKLKNDKKNLNLLKVGLILPHTKKANDVPKADMEKRLSSYQDRKKKLNNPNYKISKTRLHINNIPKDLNESELKKLIIHSIKVNTNVIPKIKQIKILYKKNLKNDQLVSTGCGFVELDTHENALQCLKYLNNNPTIWSKNKRPIVEFALDNAIKIHQRQKRLNKLYEQRKEITELRKQAEDEALKKLKSDKSDNNKDINMSFKNIKKDKLIMKNKKRCTSSPIEGEFNPQQPKKKLKKRR